MNTEDVYTLLGQVKDPEIPVLTILDLGMVREVSNSDNGFLITVTPTYSGCPATDLILENIEQTLRRNGVFDFKIQSSISPPWTTDMISREGREKLKKIGIVPPQGKADKNAILGREVMLTCPRCGSQNTELTSQFGSTACKALYKCKDCQEPFQYFKCI